MFEKGKLCDFSKSRDNNLNIMRVIAAVLVIACHSVPICKGAAYEDVVGTITGGILNLGGIAVGFFFVTGGYLIAQSAERKKRATKFFKARVTRIFPPLFWVVIISIFVIGPLCTSLSLGEYFTNVQTYKYFLNACLIPIHNLPGVFQGNMYQDVVNGPLWTLPIEFFCYIGCFVVYKLGLFDKKKFKFTIPLFVICTVSFFCLFGNNIVLVRIVRPILLYYIGIAFYIFRDVIVIDIRLGFLCIIAFIGVLLLGFSNIAMLVFFPYAVFCLGFGIRREKYSSGNREISYGMYLWGWPVQQMLYSVGGIFTIWYYNLITAAIIAMLLGLLNNLFVEDNEWIKKRKLG